MDEVLIHSSDLPEPDPSVSHRVEASVTHVVLHPRPALKAPHMAAYGAIGDKWYVRPHRYKAGQTHEGHTHVTEHLTQLLSGRIAIDLRGPNGEADRWEAEAPFNMVIRAHWHHTIHVLTDAFWYCTFFDSRDAGDTAPFHAERP